MVCKINFFLSHFLSQTNAGQASDTGNRIKYATMTVITNFVDLNSFMSDSAFHMSKAVKICSKCTKPNSRMLPGKYDTSQNYTHFSTPDYDIKISW